MSLQEGMCHTMGVTQKEDPGHKRTTGNCEPEPEPEPVLWFPREGRLQVTYSSNEDFLVQGWLAW